MLDAALRCENAHHEDPEILNHLDVVLQAPFPGDCGWDIISLQYTVHGPLATMLEPTMPIYKAIFKPLWRMKHIEFVLSMKIWNVQMSNAKVSLLCLCQCLALISFLSTAFVSSASAGMQITAAGVTVYFHSPDLRNPYLKNGLISCWSSRL